MLSSTHPQALIVNSSKTSSRVGWAQNPLPSVELAPRSLLRHDELLRSSSKLLKDSQSDAEVLWALSIENFFYRYSGCEDRVNSSVESPLVLCDNRFITADDKTAAAEFFFESLGVSSLSIPQESTSLMFALRRLAFNSHVTESHKMSARRTPLVKLDSPFTGLLVNAETDSTRLTTCVAGVAWSRPLNFPIGSQLPSRLISLSLHEGQIPSLHAKNFQRISKGRQMRHCCCQKLSRSLFQNVCDASLDLNVDLMKWGEIPRKTNHSSGVPHSNHSNGIAHQNGVSRWNHLNHSNHLNGSHSGGLRCYLTDVPPQPNSPETVQVWNASNPLRDIARALPFWKCCATEFKSVSKVNGVNGQEPAECCICSEFQDSSRPIRNEKRHEKRNSNALEFQPQQCGDFIDILADPLSLTSRGQWDSLRGTPEFDSILKRCLRGLGVSAAEVYFTGAKALRPSAQIPGDLFPNEGIAKSILSMFEESPIDYRKTLYSNIVVLGGVAHLPTFPWRLLKEIKNELFEVFHRSCGKSAAAAASLDRVAVRVVTPTNPIENRYAAWIGAREMWNAEEGLKVVTKEEFAESGWFGG